MKIAALLSALLLSGCASTCNRPARTTAIVLAGVTAAGLGVAFFRPEIGVSMPVVAYGTAGAAAGSVIAFHLSRCEQ